MKKHLISFLTAMRFLTIIPLPWHCERDSEHFSESVKFFAAVGLLIGLFTSLSCYFFSFLAPHLVLCALSLLLLAGISGFLHLDGLADTADGFLSARPKEQILEIMHDSRTGAMGVIALVFILLFKFAALASLSTENLVIALFLIPLAGRCAIILTMAYMPYARAEGGLGKMFYTEKLLGTTIISLILFFLSGSIVINFYITSMVFFTVLATIIFWGMWCKKMIGGTTGDTLGAVCEITETTVSVALACLLVN